MEHKEVVYPKYPDGLSPIKDQMDAKYECIFILYHTFTKYKLPEGFDSPSWKMWPKVKDFSEVPWSEIIEEAAFKDEAELAEALAAGILAIEKTPERQLLIDRLQIILDKHEGLLPPAEGEMSQELFIRVLDVLEKIGYQYLCVDDEFQIAETVILPMARLKKGGDAIPPSASFSNLDNDFLIVTHWDSHYSFICGKKDVVEKIVDKGKFEGFYCDDHTVLHWFIEDMNP